MWTDLTRSINGYFRNGSGSNHVNAITPNPTFAPNGSGGGNVAYRDGHVEWRRQDELVYRYFTDISGGNLLYGFY